MTGVCLAVSKHLKVVKGRGRGDLLALTPVLQEPGGACSGAGMGKSEEGATVPTCSGPTLHCLTPGQGALHPVRIQIYKSTCPQMCFLHALLHTHMLPHALRDAEQGWRCQLSLFHQSFFSTDRARKRNGFVGRETDTSRGSPQSLEGSLSPTAGCACVLTHTV